MLRLKIMTFVISCLIFLLILDLSRKGRLTFKYALFWIVLSLAGMVLALCEGFLYRLSAALGFQLMSNFIFFLVGCAFVVLSLLLTVWLCQQNRRNDRMAQKIALLEAELNNLKK